MLEPPNLPNETLRTWLLNLYGLEAVQVRFLPLGYDIHTAVYRVTTGLGTQIFLKLRTGPFDEISVTLPRFLYDTGNKAIVPPLPALDQRLWGRAGSYTTIIYPFVEGENGYRVELSGHHWVDFGAALRQVHTSQPPASIRDRLPRENFSPEYRLVVQAFQQQVDAQDYLEPVAAKLAEFMREQRAQISRLVVRAADLAQMLRSAGLEFVLCHSDIHPGNILVGENGTLYLVDWDNPILAPKERDLLLIGGCPTWNDPRAGELFYEGYGQVSINPQALVYYRFERVIMDIAAFCQQLLASKAGGEEREQSYQYFISNFLPDHEIDLALQIDRLP